MATNLESNVMLVNIEPTAKTFRTCDDVVNKKPTKKWAKRNAVPVLLDLEVTANGGDLCQTVPKLINSIPAGPVLCTFMQYSITICNLAEAAHVVSGIYVNQILFGNDVKFVYPGLSSCREIPLKLLEMHFRP